MTEAAPIQLDESPAGSGEWGYRPADGAVIAVTPPGFSWRPQKGIVRWEVEVATVGGTEETRPRWVAGYNVFCPPVVLRAGQHTWRYRGFDANDNATNWSRARSFSIAVDAVEMPLPRREELLGRIPKTHPRLFVRPEQMDELRTLVKGKLKDRYEKLVAECEKLLKNPPPTAEPPTYPEGTQRGSDPWRKIWWGNRVYTTKALNGAATLAFTRLLGGREEYGKLAKRILLDCAKWDPKGSTGYRYNDEAGMPYNYYFSRTYSFVHDLLSEKERNICRRVMKIRGDEMYHHLRPIHFWKPFGSHRNRAWHFLGEIGVAFHGEVEGADEWVWYATNVFFNCYPVWADDDGGWHEGSNYWRSYQQRFTWWADVMRAALGVNAYNKPYYSKVGYYAMYLMPPGKVGGGFGDLTARSRARHNRQLVSTYAAQAQNPHWAWYVEKLGGMTLGGGYVGFVRGAMPEVPRRVPTDLPASRLFRGTGQAYLNTSLLDARGSVQVVFKSSRFGTQSHGYEANNAFLLWAYGQRLLIRSGRRDSYGSAHHKRWMWSTRSVNCITVNGEGQGRRTAAARGEITAFKTTPEIDIVVGEAAGAYVDEDGNGPKRPLERFTRAIIFVKPELVVVYDRLVAKEPSTFQYWLHAVNKFRVTGQHDIQVRRKNVRCEIDFLAPDGLAFEQTNQYDPNPRPRIKLREWHLTASAPEKRKSVEFIAIYRPHRKNVTVPREAKLEKLDGGYALQIGLTKGKAIILLPTRDQAVLKAHGLNSLGAITVARRDANGNVVRAVSLRE